MKSMNKRETRVSYTNELPNLDKWRFSLDLNKVIDKE